jgi:hypothetical protein
MKEEEIGGGCGTRGGEERCGVCGDIWSKENTMNTRHRRNDNIKMERKEDSGHGLSYCGRE